MISSPPPAKWAKFRFLLFTARHVLGLCVFAWLTVQAYHLAGGVLWLIVPLAGVVYGAFAFSSAQRLWSEWRQRGEGR